MKLAKNHTIFIAFWGSLIGGILFLSLTQEASLQAKYSEPPEANASSEAKMVEVVDYTNQVRPWLQSVAENYSPAAIKEVKAKLLAFKSTDQFLGRAHINLFLVFETWDQFLNTNDNTLKEQTKNQLRLVSELLPGLSPELGNLQSILN